MGFSILPLKFNVALDTRAYGCQIGRPKTSGTGKGAEGDLGQTLSPVPTPYELRVALAKLSQAVRRNELLLLASLLSGLVMALFVMALGWADGMGIWAFPGYVSAVAFRSLQAGGIHALTVEQIAAGLALHMFVALFVGVLFARIAPRVREALGLDAIAETPAYGLLGAGFGASVFAVAWWGILPYANPVMLQGVDPMHFGIAHGVWGLCLGVTRKAWAHQSPSIARDGSPPSNAAPVAAGHAGSSSSASASGSPTKGQASSTSQDEDEEPGAEARMLQPEDPTAVEAEAGPGTHEDPNWGEAGAGSGVEDDDLSPWPDPPKEDDDPYAEEDDPRAGSSNDGLSGTSSSASRSASSDSAGEDEDDEPVYVTEHARRSLRGLTGQEPEIPPVHRMLKACLTHVAPGRAVCTLDGGQRQHDATGVVQAGMLASLAEVTAAVAMRTVAPEEEHVIVTSTIEVDGEVDEGHIVAEAQVTEQAGTTTLAEVEVRDATGQVLLDASFQAVSDEEADF